MINNFEIMDQARHLKPDEPDSRHCDNMTCLYRDENEDCSHFMFSDCNQQIGGVGLIDNLAVIVSFGFIYPQLGIWWVMSRFNTVFYQKKAR